MCRSGLSGYPRRAHALWQTQFPSWQNCLRSALLLVRPEAQNTHEILQLFFHSIPALLDLQSFKFLFSNGVIALGSTIILTSVAPVMLIKKDLLTLSFSHRAGSMTILPTVLFLLTGVLRETAVKSVDNSVPVPVSAALQGIKTIITSPLAQVQSVQTQWTGLVRSSLASVLEYSQPGEPTRKHIHHLCFHF